MLIRVIIVFFFGYAYSFPKQFTIDLSGKQKMCFYESLEMSKKYILSYRVIKGGNNDIDVHLISPTKKITYERRKNHFDNFSFKTLEAGVFTLCFSNEFSSFSHKQVYFELRPAMFESLQEEAGMVRVPTALTLMESSLDNIHVHLSEVDEYQILYKNEETEVRIISDHLNQGVLFWSVLVALGILVTGYGQVVVLKTFFSDRPVVGSKITNNM